MMHPVDLGRGDEAGHHCQKHTLPEEEEVTV